MRIKSFIFIAILGLLLAACADDDSGGLSGPDTVDNSTRGADKALKNTEETESEKDKDSKDDETKPPEVMYNEAQDKLAQHSYKSAAKEFLNIERDHPYSKWSQPAQVQAAYAYYKEEQYDDVITTLQRFIKLNQGNSQVPYCYYLIALSYYNRITDVGRDQDITLKAQTALRDVMTRYPDSDYARDAKLKLDLTEDQLAGKEMAIGRYYLKRKEYVSAINRFETVVQKFSSTAQIEEALYRLVECYMAIGVTPEAQKYAAVLGHNYPGGEWYNQAYALLNRNNAVPEELDSSGTHAKSWYDFW